MLKPTKSQKVTKNLKIIFRLSMSRFGGEAGQSYVLSFDGFEISKIYTNSNNCKIKEAN
jgi:hypothetical protein